ncbi:oxidoreductase YteT [Penicillium angulare]|uniref:Oxidoreductase YteT n=1 Tax=Penicillium angulare TaxID=116970 RepID=A0A9W9FAM7_9EURO|nr:oxidoreductase YteT [Penicillium angulare]
MYGPRDSALPKATAGSYQSCSKGQRTSLARSLDDTSEYSTPSAKERTAWRYTRATSEGLSPLKHTIHVGLVPTYRFRRWHRDKRNSGGLLVHKSTHHFDLVNFWLQSRPDTVYAQGDLRFYGKENAESRGVTQFYSRAHGSEAAKEDPFALHLADNPGLKALYLDAEQEDGYYRDHIGTSRDNAPTPSPVTHRPITIWYHFPEGDDI